MNRYFSDQAFTTGATVTLSDTIAHHALKVLRQTTGDQFELVNAAHRAFVATITAVAPLTGSSGADVTRAVELPLEVTVVCGVGKGDKAEWIAQKATELGAAHILFYNGQWGTSKWAPDRRAKKLARLQAIVLGAAEQSHRNVVPTVGFLADLATLAPAGAKLVAYEESAKAGEAAGLVATLAARPQALTGVFGPEGGISPAELAELTANGFVPAGLGPRILRTETAPLYLLSAVSALSELQGVQLDE